jgi:7-carboxy-7-deazaguanine synthase
MKVKISEIFQSLQGEGKYVGERQVFVRFFACNLDCPWCDTPKSKGKRAQHYHDMTFPKVLAEICRLKNGCRSVSLTGGEPLLQKDFLKTLLPALKKLRLQTYLDTNGILFAELRAVIGDIDIIAMDFKLPSSMKGKSYWDEHRSFLKIARRKDVFAKMVVSAKTLRKDLTQAVKIINEVAPRTSVILQPNSFELRQGAVQKCLEYQSYCLKYLSDVRIVPQMHKYLGLR